MNTTKRILLATVAALGMAAATAGPALAGLWINHSEPLVKR